MTINAVIRARIDETIKEDAAAVLSDMGLTVSDYIRMAITRVAKDRAIPFDTHIPNAVTRKALEDSDKGIGVKSFDNVEDMFKDLGI